MQRALRTRRGLLSQHTTTMMPTSTVTRPVCAALAAALLVVATVAAPVSASPVRREAQHGSATNHTASTAAPRLGAGPVPPVDAWNVAQALSRYGYTAQQAAPLLSKLFPAPQLAAEDAATALAAGWCNDVSGVVIKQLLAANWPSYSASQVAAAVAALGPEVTPTSLAVLGASVFSYPMSEEAAAIKKSYPTLTSDELADALSVGYCNVSGTGKNFSAGNLEDALMAAGFSAAVAHTTSLRYFDQYHVSFVSMARLLADTGYGVGEAAHALVSQFGGITPLQLGQALGYGWCHYNVTATQVISGLLHAGNTWAKVATVCFGGTF